MINQIEPTFDVKRALLLEKPLQETLHVQKTVSLAEALRQGSIGANVQVLVSDLPDQPLVFESWHLLAHPVAEGDWHALPYVAAFCAICNSATFFNAQVDKTHYHFTQGGIYNGMMLLRDNETGSYWNHVTGECVYGTVQGTQLKRLNTLRFMTARQAAVAYPEAALVKAQLNTAQNEWARQRDLPRLQPIPDYGPLIGAVLPGTISVEDLRLPRFEMGLGVWADQAARYYPLQQLRLTDNLVLERFNGRTLLVYIDPQSETPTAFFVESMTATWQDHTILLDNGVSVRDGVIIASDGQMRPAEHPNQLFQRWMGFSLTFPGCQIYGR